MNMPKDVEEMVHSWTGDPEAIWVGEYSMHIRTNDPVYSTYTFCDSKLIINSTGEALATWKNESDMWKFIRYLLKKSPDVFGKVESPYLHTWYAVDETDADMPIQKKRIDIQEITFPIPNTTRYFTYEYYDYVPADVVRSIVSSVERWDNWTVIHAWERYRNRCQRASLSICPGELSIEWHYYSGNAMSGVSGICHYNKAVLNLPHIRYVFRPESFEVHPK